MTTHRRIRPFNTRETYPEQNLDNDLCQAVVAGNTVYLRGQIGQDLDTRESVGIGDVAAQTERVLTNLAAVIGAAGASWHDVVKTTVYLAEMADFPRVNEVYARMLGDARPARSTVQVAGLPRGVLVEIDAIVAVGEQR